MPWNGRKRSRKGVPEKFLLTSMDADGTKDGYDIELTAAVSSTVGIPVIASGGAGNLEHLLEVLTQGKADAVLAASIFHFGEYTVGEAKRFLACAWRAGSDLKRARDWRHSIAILSQPTSLTSSDFSPPLIAVAGVCLHECRRSIFAGEFVRRLEFPDRLDRRWSISSECRFLVIFSILAAFLPLPIPGEWISFLGLAPLLAWPPSALEACLKARGEPL